VSKYLNHCASLLTLLLLLPLVVALLIGVVGAVDVVVELVGEYVVGGVDVCLLLV
jgi:hypothetical protein